MTISAMRLAAIHYRTGFPIDDFLARVGALLRADHIRVGGAIQLNVAEPGRTCGAMTLVDLSSGTAMEISQQLGSLAQGCRLDTGRLAEFGTLLERLPDEGVELLILNKFGRAEAEGHGLRRNIERALNAGVAVLTAVRAPYDDAWRVFHGGLATDLPPDLENVRAWCHTAVAQGRLRETPVVPLSTVESA
jgi:nucleoside-triphosphatase THEP1